MATSMLFLLFIIVALASCSRVDVKNKSVKFLSVNFPLKCVKMLGETLVHPKLYATQILFFVMFFVEKSRLRCYRVIC